MLKLNPEIEKEVLIKSAEEICIAARTAPKSYGEDSIVTAIIYDEELKKLQQETRKIGEEKKLHFLLRDGENINDKIVVLIGTSLKTHPPLFLDNEYIDPCIDLGIAIGSAVSTASVLKIDNRIMLSIGLAAVNLKILGEDVKIAYGMPLSISGKNPFFDRKK
ncbi:MAG: DUF2148 domain-containing protein [Campylobacterota bacterium]|nr:DUF2148 domain-containing protein [Campylobacterota bacterium]